MAISSDTGRRLMMGSIRTSGVGHTISFLLPSHERVDCGAEREALEQAIENAQLIVEAADRLLEDTKGKEKGKN